MIIEGLHTFSEDQALTGASVSAARPIDVLGLNGNAYINPFVSIRLTQGFTAGAVSTIDLMTSDNADMSGAVKAVTYTVPATIDQTKPAVLVQETLPRNLKKYSSLIYNGTDMAGGKVFASIVTGVATNGSVSL